jgi:predicted nucleic acid-binding Zn ribbon protein
VIRVSGFAPSLIASIVRPAPICAEKVSFAWRASVGPAVANVTSAVLDANGVLTVTTPDVAWRREVQRSSRLIQHRLEAMLGPDVVRSIVVTAPSTR